MKWTLQELRNRAGDFKSFEETLDLEAALKARQAHVIALEQVRVKGYLIPRLEDVVFQAELSTTVCLPSTRTLEPVSIPLTFEIKERYVTSAYQQDDQDYEEITIVLEDDLVDFEEVLVDNLISNLPIKVVGPEELDQELPSGRNWAVLTEDAVKESMEDQVDSRFEALRALLDDVE